jgi:hypothetical protein
MTREKDREEEWGKGLQQDGMELADTQELKSIRALETILPGSTARTKAKCNTNILLNH